MTKTVWILQGALERGRREIAAAESMEALLGEVARFLAALPGVERASVPEGFLPRYIRTQQDLSHWAARLHPLQGEGDALRAVRDLVVHAARHAQHLRPRRNPLLAESPRYVR